MSDPEKQSEEILSQTSDDSTNTLYNSAASRASRGQWVNDPDIKPAVVPLENANAWQLAKMLVPATLSRIVAAIPAAVRRTLITVFAIIAMVAPLALWIAPSTTVWFSILGLSLFSIAMLVALVTFGPEEFY